MYIRLIDYTPSHTIGVIETKGKEYACHFAKEFDNKGNTTYPTTNDVKEAWVDDKRFFEPYQTILRGV